MAYLFSFLIFSKLSYRHARRYCWLFALGLTIALTGCRSGGVARQAEDFDKTIRPIQSIALLPPEAEFTQKELFDDKPDAETAATIKQALTEVACQVLKRHGYQVKTDLLTKLDGHDPALSAEYEQFRAAHTDAIKRVYELGTWTTDYRAKLNQLDLGPAARTLAMASGADAMLAINYSGFSKSPARVVVQDTGVVVIVLALVAASEILPGTRGRNSAEPDEEMVYSKHGCKVKASLIDSKSGNILWVNAWTALEDRKVQGAACRIDLNQVLSRALNRLPSKDVQTNAKKKKA